MILDFILGRWKAILVGLLITGVVGTFFVMKTELNYKTKKLQESEANYAALENSYSIFIKTVQNAAVLEKQRSQDAQDQLKKARSVSTVNKKEASAIAALVTPKGESECKAVEELLNGQI